MKRFIGIDPGLRGALAFMDEEKRLVCWKTETTAPKDAFLDAICGIEARDVVVYIELVGGYIGKPQPASRAGKLMRNMGYWEGLCAGMNISIHLVRPQEWQAGISGVAGKKDAERKRALRDEAIRRFPAMKPTLATCDALLIADFGRRVEMGVQAK
jgi:hypothetical protein